MTFTPRSWWQNKRTGQKMAVAEGMLNQHKHERRRIVKHGLGRDPDRTPCYLEGTGLYLAWLTEDELDGAWKQLRVKPDDASIPEWLRRPRMNDFSYMPPDPPYKPFEPYWVSVLRIRSGWLCLSGMVQDEVTGVHHERKGPNGETIKSEGHFEWGLQAYNTFFLPASEAVPRLTPRFDKIRTSIYDHINQGGAIE